MNQKSLRVKVLHHEIDRDAVDKKSKGMKLDMFDALYLIMTCFIHINFHLKFTILKLIFLTPAQKLVTKDSKSFSHFMVTCCSQ